MRRKLWQRLVIWFSLRLEGVRGLAQLGDGRLRFDSVRLDSLPFIAVVPKVPLDGIERLRRRQANVDLATAMGISLKDAVNVIHVTLGKST